jgi:hypothetical protein
MIYLRADPGTLIVLQDNATITGITRVVARFGVVSELAAQRTIQATCLARLYHADVSLAHWRAEGIVDRKPCDLFIAIAVQKKSENVVLYQLKNIHGPRFGKELRKGCHSSPFVLFAYQLTCDDQAEVRSGEATGPERRPKY